MNRVLCMECCRHLENSVSVAKEGIERGISLEERGQRRV